MQAAAPTSNQSVMKESVDNRISSEAGWRQPSRYILLSLFPVPHFRLWKERNRITPNSKPKCKVACGQETANGAVKRKEQHAQCVHIGHGSGSAPSIHAQRLRRAFGHGGPAFVDVAAEVETPRRAGPPWSDCPSRELVGTLQRTRAGLIVVRRLPATVAVSARSNPVELEQATVAAVGDHAAQFGIQPGDDRLGVRKRPADSEMKRACEQRCRDLARADRSGRCRPNAALYRYPRFTPCARNRECRRCARPLTSRVLLVRPSSP